VIFRLFLAAVLASALSCGGDPEPKKTAVKPAAKPAAEAPAAEAPAVQESEPAPVEQPAPQPEPAKETPAQAEPAAPPAFDPNSVSQEEKDAAKVEIQQLIQKLNGIIKAKNYNSWVSYLDPAYFKLISSKEYLDRINKTERMQKAGISLKNARDFFTNVVVPSRANDRVDDIEFVSQNRVKAYTVSQKGERLRLYDLEKSDGGWKIIN